MFQPNLLPPDVVDAINGRSFSMAYQPAYAITSCHSYDSGFQVMEHHYPPIPPQPPPPTYPLPSSSTSFPHEQSPTTPSYSPPLHHSYHAFTPCPYLFPAQDLPSLSLSLPRRTPPHHPVSLPPPPTAPSSPPSDMHRDFPNLLSLAATRFPTLQHINSADAGAHAVHPLPHADPTRTKPPLLSSQPSIWPRDLCNPLSPPASRDPSHHPINAPARGPHAVNTHQPADPTRPSHITPHGPTRSSPITPHGPTRPSSIITHADPTRPSSLSHQQDATRLTSRHHAAPTRTPHTIPMDLLSSPTKLTMFSGSNPISWLLNTQLFFLEHPWPLENRFQFIALHLEGFARKWFELWQPQFDSWEKFKEVFIFQFVACRFEMTDATTSDKSFTVADKLQIQKASVPDPRLLPLSTSTLATDFAALARQISPKQVPMSAYYPFVQIPELTRAYVCEFSHKSLDFMLFRSDEIVAKLHDPHGLLSMVFDPGIFTWEFFCFTSPLTSVNSTVNQYFAAKLCLLEQKMDKLNSIDIVRKQIVHNIDDDPANLDMIVLLFPHAAHNMDQLLMDLNLTSFIGRQFAYSMQLDSYCAALLFGLLELPILQFDPGIICAFETLSLLVSITSHLPIASPECAIDNSFMGFLVDYSLSCLGALWLVYGIILAAATIYASPGWIDERSDFAYKPMMPFDPGISALSDQALAWHLLWCVLLDGKVIKDAQHGFEDAIEAGHVYSMAHANWLENPGHQFFQSLLTPMPHTHATDGALLNWILILAWLAHLVCLMCQFKLQIIFTLLSCHAKFSYSLEDKANLKGKGIGRRLGSYRGWINDGA